MLRDTGLLGPRTVLAHGVHVTDADIALIAEAGAAIAHCPASNLKLASGFARITDLHTAGVTVSLGTDGAASANDLDPFLAMRLAAYPQSALHGAGSPDRRPSGGDGDDQRRRRARHRRSNRITRARQTGRPVVLDAASPALTPSYDPVSTLAYAASRADVRWVVAGGRVAVDDRVLRTVDVDAAVQAVRDLAPYVLAAAGPHP